MPPFTRTSTFNRLAPPTGVEARAIANQQGPMDDLGLEQIAGFFERSAEMSVGAVTAHRLRLLSRSIIEKDYEIEGWQRTAELERAQNARLASELAKLAQELKRAAEEHTVIFVFKPSEDAEPGSIGIELGMELAYLLAAGERT